MRKRKVKSNILNLLLVVTMLLVQINLVPLVAHATVGEPSDIELVTGIEEADIDSEEEIIADFEEEADIGSEEETVADFEEETDIDLEEEAVAAPEEETDVDSEAETDVDSEEEIVVDLEEVEEIELLSAPRTIGSGIVQFELRPVGNLPAGVTAEQARNALMNVTTVTHTLSRTAGGAVAAPINGAFGRTALFLGETGTHYRIYLAGFEGWVAKEGATHNVTITVDGRSHSIRAQAIAVYFPFGSYGHGQGRTASSTPKDINLLEFADQTVPFVEDDISPLSGQTQVRSVSYYVNRDGVLHRILTGNAAATLPARPWGHIVGPAPSWMSQDRAYYSFDGIFFYRNPRDIRPNGQGAVNVNNLHFNYFQYLSFRSQSSLSAADLNNFIVSQLNAEERGQSAMVNSGQHFINSQNTFGTNALLQFAKAIHESGRGLSNIARNNNNLFGLNAVDSNPDGNASQFPTVQASINDHADGWMSRGYLYPRDWRHAGPHVGHKGSGMNVRYATDPYWGEKIAGWAWRIDRASGSRDLNRETIGVMQNNSSVNVVNAAGNTLYTANSGGFRFYPFLITGTEGNRLRMVTSGAIENNVVSRNARFNRSTAVGFIPNSNLWLSDTDIDGTVVSYRTHIQNIGWQSTARNGRLSGTTGQGRQLEAIEIELDSEFAGGIEYRTHIQDIGWQGWRSDGQTSGTTGQNRRLEAIEIRLTGDVAEKYDVYYRVHVQNFGWLDWAKNGESAGTAGYGFRAEAIEIVVVEKGGGAPGRTATPFRQAPTFVNYSTHIQGIGWQANRRNGAISGTTGQARRLEAIRINLSNREFSGGIQYRTHIQDIGWERNWAANGALSGTTGQARRLEAIQIELTGEMQRRYDVRYRVHVEGIGWTGWVRNGEVAGTTGQARRLEAIQVELVRR